MAKLIRRLSWQVKVRTPHLIYPQNLAGIETYDGQITEGKAMVRVNFIGGDISGDTTGPQRGH
jgi:hypothetical protein